MQHETNIKDLLIRSFDEELSPDDAVMLEDALKQSSALRAEKQRLEQMRRAIAELQAPEDGQFAQRVMAKLREGRKKTLNSRLVSIFPKVAAACLLVFMLSLLAIYFSSGTLSIDAIIGVEELTPEDASIYLGYN